MSTKQDKIGMLSWLRNQLCKNTVLSMHCVLIIKRKKFPPSENLQHLGQPWEKKKKKASVTLHAVTNQSALIHSSVL